MYPVDQFALHARGFRDWVDGGTDKGAAAARSALRAGDEIGRIGGEELLAVLPDATPEAAADVAERLRTAIAAADVSEIASSLRVTVSIGVAAFPDHDTGALPDLARSADDALYRAKRAGRDRVVPFAA